MFFWKKKQVRTRFAPSPTGYLHIGGLKTILYAYLFAKQNGGDLVLRVEDTDQTRQVAGAVESLLNILKWLGLEANEGILLSPDGKAAEKGRFGPYTQSQRVPIYQKYAQKLVAAGQAYYCFCSPQRLENLRKEQEVAGKPTKYDFRCRHLTEEEVKAKLANGEKYVIRLKVPENQEIEFTDWVHRQVKFNTNDIDDQILLKSDGFPTYHLAVVIDDHLMKISHVLRGEEWVSSTPKHILLYLAFGWKPPEFIHLPLILNPDRSKLSKRQGDVAVEDYRADGYLPEALINYSALLGWNPGTEQEIFSLKELVKVFDLRKVHKAGAVFDREKLDWLNGVYIKKLPLEKFVELAMPFFQNVIASPEGAKQSHIFNQETIKKLLSLEQPRINKLSEVGQGIEFLLTEKLDYQPKLLIWKKSDRETTIKNLELLINELEKYGAGEPASANTSADTWTAEKLEKNLHQFIKNNNLTNGEVLWPMRAALTGLEKSPTPFEVANILGKEKTIKRLKEGIKKLKDV